MITLDIRESKLIETITNYFTQNKISVPLETKSLAIGDVIITHETSENVKYTIIIERKCVTDMIASIKDGRYKEQKIRLQAEMANNNNPNNRIIIVYLLEGSQTELRLPQDKTMLNGSIISSQFRDKIPLIRTYNMLESIEIISRLRDRLIKNPLDIFPDIPIVNTNNIFVNNNLSNNSCNNPDNVQSSGNTYINSLQNIKKQKKDNITPENWNIMCYMNIPGISSNIATKIANKYPSIYDLIKAYDNCEDDNKRSNLLADIILTENDKQKRRLGDVISNRVFEYIYKK